MTSKSARKRINKISNERETFKEVSLLIKDHDFESAMDKIEKYLDKDPESVYLLDLKAKLLIAYQSYNEAEELLNELINRDPKNINYCRCDLGIIYKNTGRRKQAIEIFEKIVNSNHHEKGHALIQMAIVYMMNDNYSNACACLLRVIRENDSCYDEAYLGLIDCKLAQRKYSDAYQLYDCYSARDKNKKVKNHYYLTSGMINENKGNIAESRNYYLKCYNSGLSYSKRCGFLLAELEFKVGNRDRAFEICNELSLGNVSIANAKLIIGNFYVSCHEYQNALESYKEGLDEKNSGLENVLKYKIGFCDVILRNYNEAKTYLVSVHNDEDYTNFDASFELIFIYIKENDYDNAYKVYENIKDKVTGRFIALLEKTKFYLDKILGKVIPYNYDDLPYSFKQIIEYSDASAIDHITKHFIHSENTDNKDDFVFNSNLTPNQLFYEVKSKLNEDTFIKNDLFDIHIVNYPNCGSSNKNELTDKIKVISLASTNDIITMYPVNMLYLLSRDDAE